MRVWPFHRCKTDPRVLELLAQILTTVHQLGASIMASEKDLQADLDAIQSGVTAVLAAQTAQAATIADLKAQLAAGTPVSQAQLDALDAEAKSIVAALTPLAPSA